MPDPRWHTLTSDETLAELGSTPEGLDPEEAESRLARYGPNRLRRPKRVSALRVLSDQFRSVVVLLLVVATVAAFLMGDVLEGWAIAVVLLINTAIGFGVELRARRAMEALLEYEVPNAIVIRGGEAKRIPADHLVPGDLMRLRPGDAVPADARLLDSDELRVNESSLTGESTPVGKTEAALDDPETPLAERSSMVYAGTSVAAGQGEAIVVATGMETELGRIGTMLEGIQEERTPLERRLDALGRRLVWLTLAITAVVVGSGVLQGLPWTRMLEAGIALAIAAVPEGLPAVATIALAVGLRRMARRRALVRRLAAVEALGSTTVVCTDKTGTLTAGEMTATRVVGPGYSFEVKGAGFTAEGEFLREGAPFDPTADPRIEELVTAAALTARAEVGEGGEEVVGDPTDAALLVFARKAGLEREALLESYLERGEIPFSSERRLSASFHRGPEGDRVWVKGAPTRILELSERLSSEEGEEPLDEDRREAILATNEMLAREGLRVIALAVGPGGRDDQGNPTELTFLGLVGLIDPPAPGVRETIESLERAGIRTVMVTGDQSATAEAIARDLGAMRERDETLDGRELARTSDEELVEVVERVGAFSRVTAEDKLRIVTAFQERGEIVAMLGDGVNDAAALKKADVGVAMGGRGTDVAKETAALVLQDDRFPTIAAAVEEGRVIFENIRKFVFYLFSCNLAEVLVLLGASLAGLPLPLLPLQILWLNLVTDTFPALALAMEPGEPDVMRRSPRDPGAAILSRGFVRSLGAFALLITAVTLVAYVWGLGSGSTERAVTLSFLTLGLAQLFHLGNARSRKPVIRPQRIVSNPWAVAAVPLVITLQVLAVHWEPLARVLRTVPLTPTEWLVVGGLAIVPAVIGQTIEVIQERRA